jgi:hypothetical protein
MSLRVFRNKFPMDVLAQKDSEISEVLLHNSCRKANDLELKLCTKAQPKLTNNERTRQAHCEK